MAVSLPLVSVCTVTHNRPALLELLGECVRAQAYPPDLLEWVIVDDSSLGPPPDLADVRAAGIAVVHLVLPDRQSIGAKRNLCHARASGELLVLMDDDDYYPPSRVPEAVRALMAGPGVVAGCPRMPLLLLPEESRWMTPALHPNDATANTLAYNRAYLEAGHGFDPEAWEGEELSFLDRFQTPLLPLDPLLTLTCIGHGGNTVDKRLWLARTGVQRFERLSADAPGFPPSDFLKRYRRALGIPPGPTDAAQPERVALEQPACELRSWRVAVITPYHQEDLAVLQRCHRSVLAQSQACTHLLVADGPGHPELASWDCRHLVLGVGHADNGNTPRSLGALAAMNEGFDCVAFLDADNWWAPDHLAEAITTQAAGDYAVVFSERQIVFPNGLRLTQQPDEDREHRLADTSAMVVFEPAFSSLALWAQMPPLLAPQCDRVVFSQLMAAHRCGWTGKATLVFESWYAGHFLAAGLLPPSNAKFLRRYPARVWQEAAEQFRQRSPTPVYLDHGLIGSSKPRLELVSILGPARSGGTLLQSGLCRHFSYYGIPENQFLAHLVSCCGADHRLRHEGAALQQALAVYQPPQLLAKAHDLRPRGLEQAISTDRSFTLLEAYFRVVQRLTPTEALEFSRAWGQVMVLERSCTQALVADVLFRCLPEHRAVLMLRDPLEQIASVRRMQQQHPQAWSYGDGEGRGSVEELAMVYLESLARPLAAAPPGQMRLVSFERLQAEPEQVLEEVSGFLGLAPNPLLALEPLPADAGQGVNRVHEQQWREQVARLPAQLLREEPWKEGCLMGMSGDALRPCRQGLDSLDREERRLLQELVGPVRTALIWLEQLAQDPNLEPPELGEPDPAADPELAALVADVVAGLVEHGGATWALEP